MALPAFSEAKIGSLISGNRPSEGDKEEIAAAAPNSQKIQLLQAPTAPNPPIGGAEITVIDGSALFSEPTPFFGNLEPGRKNGEVSVHVVREGENLSQIAEMYGVSVNTVRWGNDIKGSVISPGQVLVILPVSGVRHSVKSGDTLESIAKRYKGNLEEILSYNNLRQDSKLTIGDLVVVPDGIMPESAAPRPAPPVGSDSGYYIRPVAGARRTQGLHGYNGVDLAAPVGTPIMAAASGVVVVSRNSGWNGGYGNYVVISHSNGTQTLYAHNSRNVVETGQRVAQGEIIGYVGSTGRSTGPHLHFEVRGARNPF